MIKKKCEMKTKRVLKKTHINIIHYASGKNILKKKVVHHNTHKPHSTRQQQKLMRTKVLILETALKCGRGSLAKNNA